jgi:hypothetical protein
MYSEHQNNSYLYGLFLSPDPVLQDPANALPACRNASTGRNYNRYSYVLPVPISEAQSGNTSLKYTDPSGYLFYYKGAWLDNYGDWVSNPFGSNGGGCFESIGTGGGSGRRGDSRLDAYSDFVKSLGSSIDWREFYAQFGYKAKEIWKIGPNKIGVHYIDGKMEQLDFTGMVGLTTRTNYNYLYGQTIYERKITGGPPELSESIEHQLNRINKEVDVKNKEIDRLIGEVAVAHAQLDITIGSYIYGGTFNDIGPQIIPIYQDPFAPYRNTYY